MELLVFHTILIILIFFKIVKNATFDQEAFEISLCDEYIYNRLRCINIKKC